MNFMHVAQSAAAVFWNHSALMAQAPWRIIAKCSAACDPHSTVSIAEAGTTLA
jgi:hypothetical protein